MSTITRKIGLSLGADTCWPICFEEILHELAPVVRVGRDEVRFEVERVRIKPFSLESKVDYDLIVDRLTYWYAPAREWIKKAILMDGAYTWNNPWSIESNQKHTAYAAMMALGLPIPQTWMIPPKSYEPKADLGMTLGRYADLFDLGEVGKAVGYPSFMKPYDGGGWVGVTKLDDEAALRDAYEKSGKSLMHVQKGVIPFDRFVRCVGLGPQTILMNYDPSAPLHQRYRTDKDFVTPEQKRHIEDITLTINAFFGWDFNSCEALLKDGTWWPIDFANPCPDSQVTSLHYHFPWLVKAKIRWALFTAATKRKMHMNLDWAPFYEVRDRNLPLEKRIAEYGKLARAHFDTERFEEFCAKELANLDEVAWNYFGSERAKSAIRKKVELLFPKHEVESFTEHFFQAIQHWRADDKAARDAARGPKLTQHVLSPVAAGSAATTGSASAGSAANTPSKPGTAANTPAGSTASTPASSAANTLNKPGTAANSPASSAANTPSKPGTAANSPASSAANTPSKPGTATSTPAGSGSTSGSSSTSGGTSGAPTAASSAPASPAAANPKGKTSPKKR